jgi:fatty-acid peroxygenase
MTKIPRDKGLDSSTALLRDGYTFISNGCARHESVVFETRLMLQPTICMLGEEAARVFYDNSLFKREGAAPWILQETLLGRGGVQMLDGQAHRKRKSMFMQLMTPEEIARLVDLATGEWHRYIDRWERKDKVVLFDEVQEILCRAVCRWTGVPLDEAEVSRRTRDFTVMIEGAGTVGLRHIQGRLARNRAEKWIGDLIERVRDRTLDVPRGCALQVVAMHCDLHGELLVRHVAAVELINVLRPTVAVARYITFAALALHKHPESRRRLQAGEEGYATLFAHDVRRFYPFFPFATARVRREFDWNGYRFTKGVRVMLDLYGTDRDPRIWNAPSYFRPERFREWNGSAFNFIPQGGSEHYTNHRCAGEWPTIALIEAAACILATSMTYDVPEQNLHISLSRLPAIPESRFVISKVRRVG